MFHNGSCQDMGPQPFSRHITYIAAQLLMWSSMTFRKPTIAATGPMEGLKIRGGKELVQLAIWWNRFPSTFTPIWGGIWPLYPPCRQSYLQGCRRDSLSASRRCNWVALVMEFSSRTWKISHTYTGSSRLMRISLLRISLLRFFKTFHIYLANAILFIFC